MVKILLTILMLLYPVQFTNPIDPLPDLLIENVSLPENVSEGQVVAINITVGNRGDLDVDEPIWVAVYVDDELIKTLSIPSLSKNSYRLVNVKWLARCGGKEERLISIMVDHNDSVTEKNERNNQVTTYIKILPIPPDLSIRNVSFKKIVEEGEETYLNLTVINTGHDINEAIKVRFSIGNHSITKTLPPLPLLEETNVSFKWKVDFIGCRKISVQIDPDNVIKESNESNNIWEGSIIAKGFFRWWDKEWHYRMLVISDGEGVISLRINSTNLLEKLGLNATIDPNSFRVVAYNNSGEIIGKIPSIFNSSTLEWFALTKFSMIYFDVKENGLKEREEIESIAFRKNATILDIGEPEGWRIEIRYPKKGEFLPLNSTIRVIVNSLAKLCKVKAIMTHDGEKVEIHLCSEDQTEWYGDCKLHKKGRWNLTIDAFDPAGYAKHLETYICIEEVDLEAKWIELLSNDLREKKEILVECGIGTNFAVNGVEIELKEDNRIIGKKVLNVSKGTEKIKFRWRPSRPGILKLTMIVDPANRISEGIENNNLISREVEVKGLPDIVIENLSFPPKVTEGNPLSVDIRLRNAGHEEGKCKVCLYIAGDLMKWSDEEIVDEKMVSIKVGEVINLEMEWKKALYGKWIVGIYAFDEVGDLNPSDNRKSALLKVEQAERNPPSISNVYCDPSIVEEGGEVNFYAHVKDDTGVKKVDLIVIFPDGKEEIYSMTKTNEIFQRVLSFSEVGTYKFYVKAIDSSPHQNNASSEIFMFKVVKDREPPEIIKVWVSPRVQALNAEVEIGVVAYDNVAVESANVTIIKPDGEHETTAMQKVRENIYTFKLLPPLTGKYSFFITVVDHRGNKNFSQVKDFWVAEDIDDIDGDGVPNWWEERYGFDPFDPDDASRDEDGDGYSLLKEYKRRSDPLRSNTIAGLLPTEFLAISCIAVMLALIFSFRKIYT